MVHITALLSAAAVVQTVLCTPISRSSYSIKEKHFVPSQWRSLGRAPANNVIHLQIGVKQGQFGELERHLYEGTFPSHCLSGLVVETKAALLNYGALGIGPYFPQLVAH